MIRLFVLVLILSWNCMMLTVHAGVAIRVYQDSQCADTDFEIKSAQNQVCSVDFDNPGQSFIVSCNGAAWTVTEHKNTTTCTNALKTQTYSGANDTACVFDKDHSYVKIDCNAIIMATYTDAACKNQTDAIMTPLNNKCTTDFDNPGQSFQLTCNGAAWSVLEYKNTSTCTNPVKTQTYTGTMATDCVFDKDHSYVKVDCAVGGGVTPTTGGPTTGTPTSGNPTSGTPTAAPTSTPTSPPTTPNNHAISTHAPYSHLTLTMLVILATLWKQML